TSCSHWRSSSPRGESRHRAHHNYREAVLTAAGSGGPAVCRPGAAAARRAAKPPVHMARAGEGPLSTARSQPGPRWTEGQPRPSRHLKGGEAARSKAPPSVLSGDLLVVFLQFVVRLVAVGGD